jgi:YesN/AraC family two-component response regulator
MENKYKILIFILLSAIVVSLAVALFYFSYKALFAVLLVMSVSVLLVYCLMYDTTVTSIEVLKKKYDVAIFDELEIYFDKKKPQLNPDFKISDLAKELGISSRAIALLIKKKYGINFDEFLNRVRRAELKRLQSLMENEDVSIQILCVKAGYKNAQHY